MAPSSLIQPLLLPVLMQHCQSLLSLLIPLTVKCNYQLYHKASGTFIHCTPSLAPDHISHWLACSDNSVQRKKSLHRLPANLGRLSGAWNLFWGPRVGSIGKHKDKKQKEILKLIQTHNLNPKEWTMIGREKCLAGEDGLVGALESNSKW